MYDVRQFRRVFYIVLLVSMAGYGIALESPGHLMLGVGLVALNLWATKGNRLFAIPRWLASSIALITGLISAAGLMQGAITPLLAVSQWLYFLLLVILWSRHDNRAYAQVLVMSLVLMVAGAINTASLFFGILFIGYLFLALYCCMLFHLKVESDHALRVYHLSREHVETTTRGDDPTFNRSMRRLTTLVSTVALTLGVVVFLFFPRANTPTLMMRLQAPQQAPLTGFSERVSFEQVARITQNHEVVAHVSVSENGQPLRAEDLYLRGITLDIYTGRTGRRPGLSWQWIRSEQAWESGVNHRVSAGELEPLRPRGEREIRQTVVLKPTGTATLFAVDGAYAIQPSRSIDLHFFTQDNSLRTFDTPKSQLQYDVYSDGQTPVAPPPDPDPRPFGPPSRRMYSSGFGTTIRTSQIDPKIAEYARRPEVGGQNANGPLWSQRKAGNGPDPLDLDIAANIQNHFHTQFQYSLDLSDTTRDRDSDPIASFLYDYRRGHCEYFAGAMTLLCQSLGMQARMVIGFRAGPEDYNNIGEYYVVRQSHAHAWVEVLTPQGWRRFDPTSGTQYFAQRRNGGWFRAVADFLDYLQYKWAISVVTYSNEDRLSVWQRVESGVSSSLSQGSRLMTALRDFFNSERLYQLSSRLILGAIALSILILLAAIGLFILEKHRLYRRAQRIGLSSLPSEQQLRLARKLGFYDELLLLLARKQIHRPREMTPREFAQSLAFLPADAFEEIGRLTDVYYRVRYGDYELKQAQRRRLSASIGELSESLIGRARD